MATRQDFKAAQERIFSRPRPESRSDREVLRKTEDDGVYPSPLNVKALRLDRVVPDPDQPARTFDQQSLAELGQSLITHGQLSPILVEYLSDEDVFLLIDGERRWRAAQLVGIETLQAIILTGLSPADRREIRIAALLHREAWGSADLVAALEAYKRMKRLTTWPEVADALGVREATLAHVMIVTELAPAVRALVRDRRLDKKAAHAFCGLAEWRQEDLAQAVTASGVDGVVARRAALLMKADLSLAPEDAISQAQHPPALPQAKRGRARRTEALDQVSAAADSLARALERLRPGRGRAASIAQLLDDLERRLAEQRAALERYQARQTEDAGTPVKGMPAWSRR